MMEEHQPSPLQPSTCRSERTRNAPIPRHIRRRLRKQRNKHKRADRAPINRLPLEILQHIFLLAVQSSTHSCHPTPPYQLTYVCRRWRAAAVSYPHIWDKLSCRFSASRELQEHLTHLDFERAQRCMALEVRLYGFFQPDLDDILYARYGRDETESDALLDRILHAQDTYLTRVLMPAVLNRVRVLRLTTMRSATLDRIKKGLDLQALSGLQVLSFHGSDKWTPREHQDEHASLLTGLAAAATSLRRLEVNRNSLELAALVLTLRCLNLERAELPAVSFVLPALGKCQCIEEVRLHRCMFEPTVEGSPAPRAVTLPALRTLVLNPKEKAGWSDLFKNLECPHLKTFELSGPWRWASYGADENHGVLYNDLLANATEKMWTLDQLILDVPEESAPAAVQLVSSQDKLDKLWLPKTVYFSTELTLGPTLTFIAVMGKRYFDGTTEGWVQRRGALQRASRDLFPKPGDALSTAKRLEKRLCAAFNPLRKSSIPARIDEEYVKRGTEEVADRTVLLVYVSRG